MYIQAVSMDDLDKKLKVAAGKATEFGCTWSISKFYVPGVYPSSISGFKVVLDPSGMNTDPDRVKHFSQIKPLTTIKDVRSFLGFIAYLGKFCPDYAMTTNKLRSLTSKGTKFCWTDDY